MIKYIDKGTARQHLTDRLMESAFNNFRVRAYVDDVYVDLIDNRLPVWMDELQTYDVQEVKHGRWIDVVGAGGMLGTFVGWKCTICGYEITDRYGQYNYCPNCGSRMDEVEE